jgi:hypothetical protein
VSTDAASIRSSFSFPTEDIADVNQLELLVQRMTDLVNDFDLLSLLSREDKADILDCVQEVGLVRLCLT